MQFQCSTTTGNYVNNLYNPPYLYPVMRNKKINVLIIDDDEVDKQAVKRALRSSGYDVHVLFAHDLNSGIKMAEDNQIDCIFLDYSLPGSTGFDFLEIYKTSNWQAPVIMITAIGDEQLAVEAMKKGACDYIPKSLITSEGISQSMRYALKITEANRNTDRIEKALQESEKKLETVISNCPLILFSLDKQGLFTLFKGNGTRTLRQISEDIIGKSVYDIGTALPVQLNHYLAACLGKEKSFKSKVNDRHYEVHYIPVKDVNGILVEMMGVATDITGMKKTEEDLVKTITIAEESSKIKEQFMANMSHEIRTPVHGIMSLADILSKTNLNEEQSTYLNAVRKSADNLLVIINDILDLSKIESGKMTFENTPFDFSEVINMSIELFRHKAAEKKLELISIIPKHLPVILKGDPVRLSQIINNLVSNAIKFTEKGQVKLEVSCIESNQASCVLNFRVTDTGIGIPPQKLSAIFETFTQATTDITRKFGGTGLGLSIVKRLTELQGGFITVESELNKGTVFSVNLPMNYPEKEEFKKPAITHPDQEFMLPANLKILVVEDNDINQMIINKLLKDWGAIVENASDGMQAIEMITAFDYHVVLMDIEMPNMNGYEATSRIRKFLPHPKNTVPILAMTAHVSTKEREKCFTSGMNDYISKPFDPSEVRKKITLLAASSDTNGTMKDANAGMDGVSGNSPQAATDRLINLTFLREMADENDSFIRDFIQLFMQNAPDSVRLLHVHLENGDWEQLRQVAHKIKPSFNYLGLKELYDAAATIEEYARQGINKSELETLVKKITTTCELAYVELQHEIKLLTV